MLRVIVEGIRMSVKQFAGAWSRKYAGLVLGIVAIGFASTGHSKPMSFLAPLNLDFVQQQMYPTTQSTTDEKGKGERLSPINRALMIDLVLSGRTQVMGSFAEPAVVYPSLVDLRSSGYVSSATNHGQCNDCWSFASIVSAESNGLVGGGGSYGFSENHQNACHEFDWLPSSPLNASSAVAEPGLRCAQGAEASDESIASALGMDAARLDRLRKYRSLSNSDICGMPTKLLQRAIAKADSPKPDHPGDWASFRAMRQTDENGIVKPDGLIQGIQQRQAIVEVQLAEQMAAGLAAPSLAGISPSAWTAIGPGNIGGRIRSILVHPTQTNKMWAGSVSGGIWVSVDSGASWNPVNDFMGNLSVSSLVMNPANPNVLYAGTGEGFFNKDAVRGAGIFKSTDGGVTWSQMASTNPAGGNQWYYVNRLAVHPSNGNIMLAATGSGTYRTTDGGASWSLVASGRALDVRFNPANGNNAIIGRDNGQALYSTTAASATSTWNTATFLYGGWRVELAYARSTANTAYAVVQSSGTAMPHADLYKTTNGGTTWSYVSSPDHMGDQGWYDNAIWVDPTNSSHLIVGGIDLWRSTDGGVSFTQISQWWSQPQSPHADHHAIVSSPAYNGSTNRTIFFGNDGGVYKAQDIAAVTSVTTGWSVLNNGLGVTQFYGGAGKAAAGGRIVGGTQDNGDLKFAGTGTSWSAWEGGDGGYSAADGLNDSYLYGEYVYLSIHRSTNGGASSAIICNGITEGYGNANWGCGAGATTEANFIAPFILDPNNNNRMLAGAKSLWVSNNVKAAAPSWTAIKPPSGTGRSYYISAISVAEGNSNIIWVGHNNGKVYKTINGTAASPTWTLVSGLPARMVLRILVDKSNTNRVYVSFGGYSVDNLYLTTNGGTSWTSISGTLPSVPIGSIVRHPINPNWLYAGTEVGLFTSENGGSSWTATNDGPANVAVDELFWYSNTKLVAATHGRGMFMATLASGCSYTLSSAGISAGAAAAIGNVSVTTTTGCAWTAKSNATWITITSGASGSGNGTVGYSVAANTGASSRTGTLTIAGKTFTVTQNGVGTLPTAPAIGTATAGNASAKVAFTPGAIGSGTLVNYTVLCGTITGTGTRSPITVSGLTNGTAYTCKVRATSTVGIGPWSTLSNSVTPRAPLALPGAPIIGTATAGNASARVAFTPGAIGSGTLVNYTASCSTNNVNFINATGSVSPITVSGLTNGTAYTCKVRTTSTVGTGPWSAVSNSVTPLLASSTNVALASTGAVASASSTYSSAYPVAAINNNVRTGIPSYWSDATAFTYPDWVQINFNGAKTINRVVVYMLQDNYASLIEPTDTMTFAVYGVTDFTVQGWNGSAWVTLNTVTGNNLVKRTVTFAALTTDRIRVNITHALYGYSMLTEVQAWGN